MGWTSRFSLLNGEKIMGYLFMVATCCSCHMTIGFNPHKVPSLVINGIREPLCENCANRWNELHPESARPIQPGAYEPLNENEE